METNNALLIHVLGQQRMLQNVWKGQVRDLGQVIGYGNMMDLAQQCWQEDFVAQGGPSGAAFAVGPCLSGTVPCGCKGSCDWCEGCGWLTKKVAALKNHRRR